MNDYFYKGSELYKDKKYEEALENFKKQLSYKDKCSNSLYILSLYNIRVCYDDLKDYNKSLIYLKEAFNEVLKDINLININEIYNIVFNIIVELCNLKLFNQALIYNNYLKALISKRENELVNPINEYYEEMNKAEKIILEKIVI